MKLEVTPAQYLSCTLAIYLATVLMQRLSHPTETVLSDKNICNRIVLSFKGCPRKPLGLRPIEPQVDIENYYKIPVAKQEFWVLLSKICILFRRSLYNIT